MRPLTIALITFPVLCWAFEASIQSTSGGSNALIVKGIGLPREQFRSHLKSGLHSRFEFEFAATDNTRVLFKGNRTWKVYYDLWDEAYRVTTQETDGRESKKEFKSIDDLFKALENPQFDKIQFENKLIGSSGEIGILGLRMTLNPVSQETVERMKKWVNQRRVPGSSGALSPMAGRGGPETSAPRLGGLFNEILGREMNEAKRGSVWSFEETAKLNAKEGAR